MMDTAPDLSSLAELPVNACLASLHAGLAAGANALLVAPPGAGKTTAVPLSLLTAPWRADGSLLVLEPRRLAARAAASRMAFLLSEPVGHRVGYRTRLDSAVSAATRIEVVTTGILLRRLLADPGLDGVAAVLIDEVHERSQDADLALALLRDLQTQLRPDLRLLAMSATPDAGKLSALLDAQTIAATGRAHPITLHHAARDLPDRRALPEAMARAVRAALAEHEGNILAFLPGMAEIRRTAAELAGIAAELLILHGDLPPAEQQRALTPAPARRVVLASAIAETSLTIPGVRVVIDGGFRRAPVVDGATGLTRLTTQRVSRATATQRSGRAGREAPGVAYRLWTAAAERALPAHDVPEILAAELSGLVLTCLAWGTPPDRLPFPDPPPPGAVAAAFQLLRALGALTPTDQLTPTGHRMAALGAHPRLAALLLAARTPAEQALAADLAALLEERDILPRPTPREYAPADITLRLAALAGDGSLGADRGALARVRQAARHYRARLGPPAANTPDPADPLPGPLLAAAFPDRIAQARGEPGRFRLSGGGSANLPRTDALARSPLLAVAALDLGSSARIALAAKLDPDALPPGLTAALSETTETTLDPVSGAVLVRRRRRLGALVLADRTEPAPEPERIAHLAARAASAPETLPWTEAARQLQARVALMRALEPETWPDFSPAGLAASPETWAIPALAKLRTLAELDLAAALTQALGKALRHRLDQALPEHLALPHGEARVDYTLPTPQAAARAQAFYGLRETPKLAAGRIPLRLALLSPAGRPIAITADIASFWQTGWPDARRDMRGRYPKHDWPETPA